MSDDYIPIEQLASWRKKQQYKSFAKKSSHRLANLAKRGMIGLGRSAKTFHRKVTSPEAKEKFYKFRVWATKQSQRMEKNLEQGIGTKPKKPNNPWGI